mmetsp:Transcript_10597/g.29921  ORF Transcript_10597/g.29921 Transcript_10597/m.29921 type:complete len:139 (-) Transcript_10597:306-722(-)
MLELCLGHNHLGAEGASAMAGALRQMDMLTSLDLSYNNLRDEGAAAVDEALRLKDRMTFRDLRYNMLTSHGGDPIAVMPVMPVIPVEKGQDIDDWNGVSLDELNCHTAAGAPEAGISDDPWGKWFAAEAETGSDGQDG